MTARSCIHVVTGLPRSGTSLMMQMLCAAGIPPIVDDHRPPDLDNPRGYFELEHVKRLAQHPLCLDGFDGQAVKVIHVHLKDLPSHHDYRAIFMHRPLDEVIASQSAMLRRLGKSGAALPTQQLANLLSRQRDQARAWLNEQKHIVTLDVQYPELMATPHTVCQRIADFIGKPASALAMQQAIEPGLYRNRPSS